jgi:hypothetical protein
VPNGRGQHVCGRNFGSEIGTGTHFERKQQHFIGTEQQTRDGHRSRLSVGSLQDDDSGTKHSQTSIHEMYDAHRSRLRLFRKIETDTILEKRVL